MLFAREGEGWRQYQHMNIDTDENILAFAVFVTVTATVVTNIQEKERVSNQARARSGLTPRMRMGWLYLLVSRFINFITVINIIYIVCIIIKFIEILIIKIIQIHIIVRCLCSEQVQRKRYAKANEMKL